MRATDKARFYERDGYQDTASWLAGRFGISHWTARRWINAAHALENLPLTCEALSSGRLSLDKVLELARFATAEDEKTLISWARRVSPAAIRHRADLAARQDLEEAQSAEEDRSLRWWNYDEGKRMGLVGDFPAATGAAITRVANKVPSMPYDEELLCDPSEADLFEQRCADALTWMASQGSSRTRMRTGRPWWCTPNWGPRVAARSRTARGPTELGNLVLVCGFHHKLVHEFDWQVWLHGSEVRWFRPDGRRFDPGPALPAQEPQTQQILVSA